MERWKVSAETKKKILTIGGDLDNEKRILFILKNLGPQRFTNLEKDCNVSRSTVSKYLKLLTEQALVEKKVYREENLQETRYFITKRGEEKLDEESGTEENELFSINEMNENISKLSDLINFYREIGVDDSITFQVVRTITKIGNKFFELDQNRDLYLTLFYVLNYASMLAPNYRLTLSQFCDVYDAKKLYIDFYVDKILSTDLGFFMFVRGNDQFFFHRDDAIGTMAFRLVKDQILEEIVYLNIVGPKKIYELDKAAENIAEQMKKMGLIWDAVKEHFEILIKKLIVKISLDMGVSKTFLTDLVIQSEKLSKSQGEKNSLINIIDGSKEHEDFNIVVVSESEEKKAQSLKIKEEKDLDTILGQVQGQGFCPNCGKIILKQDFSNFCTKCGQQFNPKKLLKSIDAANEASMRFKAESLQKEELIKCPNPNCEGVVGPGWEECPVCHTSLKIPPAR